MSEIQDLTLENVTSTQERPMHRVSTKPRKSIAIKLKASKIDKESDKSVTEETTEDIPSDVNWGLPCNILGQRISKSKGLVAMCTECSRPIIVYGRLLPCNHVFCLTCAQTDKSQCTRCDEAVKNVDEIREGQLYICPISKCGLKKQGSKGYTSLSDFHSHVQQDHNNVDEGTLLSTPTAAFYQPRTYEPAKWNHEQVDGQINPFLY